MAGSLYSPAVSEFFIVCGCLTCKPDPRNEHTFDRDTGKATHTQSYPFQLLSAANVLQDSVNLLFNATSPVHDPTQHTQQNHHTMEKHSFCCKFHDRNQGFISMWHIIISFTFYIDFQQNSNMT